MVKSEIKQQGWEEYATNKPPRPWPHPKRSNKNALASEFFYRCIHLKPQTFLNYYIFWLKYQFSLLFKFWRIHSLWNYKFFPSKFFNYTRTKGWKRSLCSLYLFCYFTTTGLSCSLHHNTLEFYFIYHKASWPTYERVFHIYFPLHFFLWF